VEVCLAVVVSVLFVCVLHLSQNRIRMRSLFLPLLSLFSVLSLIVSPGIVHGAEEIIQLGEKPEMGHFEIWKIY